MSFFDLDMDDDFIVSARRFDDPVLASQTSVDPVAESDLVQDKPSRKDDSAVAVVERPDYVDLDMLPEGFRFKEGEELEHNPYVVSGVGNSDLVHRDYRRIDSERFTEISVRSPVPAIVVFEDRLQADRTSVVMGHLPQPGATKEEMQRVFTRVSYLTSTQFTGIRIHIVRPGHKEIHYRIFADSCILQQKGEQRVVGHQTITFGPHNRELIHDLLQGHKILTPLAELWRNDGQHPRPSFVGISATEVQNLVALYNDETTRTQLQPWELLVVHLQETRGLKIYRRLRNVLKDDDEELETLTKNFVDYINSVMWLNVVHGALWFYKLQSPETPLMSKEYPLDSVAVPRWMVRSWRATKNDAEEIIKCDPQEWAALPRALEYPDEQCCAFMTALGVTREAEHTRASIKQMINAKDGALRGIFRQSKAHPGQFLVDIFAPSELTASGVWKNLKPAVDTGLTIKILDPKFKVTYRGQITDDMFGMEGSRCDFVAGVTGPALTLPEDELPIEIKLRNDPTATNRALNALECLSRGVAREHGVDLCRDLFGAPPAIPQENLNALPDLLSPAALEEALDRLDHHHGLNIDQANAAKAFITEAYTLVWGPAGTGKTKTCAAAVNEIANLGVKQIFACPTNRAVDKALSDCLEINPDLKAVRFVGGFRGLKSTADDDTAMDHDDEAVMDTDEQFEMYLDQLDIKDATHAKHLFHVKKLEAIKKFASIDGHLQCENAKNYLQLREELSKAKGRTKKEIRMQLDTIDVPLHYYFLEHCVDAVFVTCSSACNEALENFKPQVVTVDEAGQATLADICMATAPFKESILSLNLTGDHVQLGPVVIAGKQNEAVYTLNVSHFEAHVDLGGERWPHYMLKEHYRSHPDITAFPNEALYKSKLQNAALTMELNGIQKTLQQLFDPLGPAWNKKWRMGIDVNGESKVYGTTTSMYNDAEADMIVNLIMKMTAFEPVDDAVLPRAKKVKLSDVGVIAVYKGQVRTIWRKLKLNGINPKSLAFLVTTASIQGADAPICLCSGVAANKNDVNKGLRYTTEAGAIAVNTTRSRYLDIYVANFGPAVEHLYKKKKGQSTMLVSKPVQMYRKLIEHLHKNGSIISAADIYRALLSDTPQRLQRSGYRVSHDYDLDSPHKSTKATGFGQRDVRKNTNAQGQAAKKRKAKGDAKSDQTPENPAQAQAPAPDSTVDASPAASGLEADLEGLQVTGHRQDKKAKLKADAAAAGLSQKAWKKKVKEDKAAAKEHDADDKKGKTVAVPLHEDDNNLMKDY